MTRIIIEFLVTFFFVLTYIQPKSICATDDRIAKAVVDRLSEALVNLEKNSIDKNIYFPLEKRADRMRYARALAARNREGPVFCEGFQELSAFGNRKPLDEQKSRFNFQEDPYGIAARSLEDQALGGRFNGPSMAMAKRLQPSPIAIEELQGLPIRSSYTDLPSQAMLQRAAALSKLPYGSNARLEMMSPLKGIHARPHSLTSLSPKTMEKLKIKAIQRELQFAKKMTDYRAKLEAEDDKDDQYDRKKMHAIEKKLKLERKKNQVEGKKLLLLRKELNKKEKEAIEARKQLKDNTRLQLVRKSAAEKLFKKYGENSAKYFKKCAGKQAELKKAKNSKLIKKIDALGNELKLRKRKSQLEAKRMSEWKEKLKRKENELSVARKQITSKKQLDNNQELVKLTQKIAQLQNEQILKLQEQLLLSRNSTS